MREYFYVPEDLDVRELLLAAGHEKLTKLQHLDKFYFIIDRIYLASKIEDGRFDEGYATVNSKVLKDTLGEYSTQIKDLLKSMGVIEEFREGTLNYTAGLCSRKYRLTEKYRGMKHRRKPIVSDSLMLKMYENQQRARELAINNHLARKLIFDSVDSLNYDAKAAREHIKATQYSSPEKKLKRNLIVELLECKGFSYIADRAGRLYHGMTSCCRDLRPYASYGQEKLYSVDYCNCQPALHTFLYPNKDSWERSRFIELVSQNKFYDFINSNIYRGKDISDEKQKQRLKKRIFHHIFYGGSKSESDVARVFRAHFPILFAAICQFKGVAGNLSALPVFMQRLESEIVIGDAAMKFAQNHANEKPCLISVHDCLITTGQHVDEVKGLMSNAFKNRMGFEIPVKVSQLTV